MAKVYHKTRRFENTLPYTIVPTICLSYQEIAPTFPGINILRIAPTMTILLYINETIRYLEETGKAHEYTSTGKIPCGELNCFLM